MPEQLRRLLAGGEAGARVGEGRLRGAALAQVLDDAARAAVEPQPGRRDRLVVRVDQPGAVALAGDGERRDLAPPLSRAASSASTAAASSQMRAMSCSAAPPGPSATRFGRDAMPTLSPSAVNATAFTTEVPESSAIRSGPSVTPGYRHGPVRGRRRRAEQVDGVRLDRGPATSVPTVAATRSFDTATSSRPAISRATCA